MKILLKLTVVKDMKVLDGSNDQLVSNVYFLSNKGSIYYCPFFFDFSLPLVKLN